MGDLCHDVRYRAHRVQRLGKSSSCIRFIGKRLYVVDRLLAVGNGVEERGDVELEGRC